MKRLFAMALLVCLVLASTGTAKAAPESWYTYWGIGWAKPSYPDEVSNTFDRLKDADFKNMSLSLDLLGFYWPLPNQQTIAGVILNANGDRYYKGDDWMQMNSYLLSASVMHFFGPEPGAGLFLRADLGMAWLALSSSETDTSGSDKGFGALVGGGYGLPISEGTRLLLNVNYALRRVEGDSYTSLGIGAGFLF